MKRRQLIIGVMLVTSSFLYSMEKEQELKELVAPCQEQQTWFSDLQKEYKRKLIMPIGRESRRLKNMWNTLPIEQQKKLIPVLHLDKLIQTQQLDGERSVTLTEAALMKQHNWDNVLIKPCGKNLVPKVLAKKALKLALSSEPLSYENTAKILFLEQLRKLHKTRRSGKKISKVLEWMRKDIVETTALQRDEEICQ